MGEVYYKWVLLDKERKSSSSSSSYGNEEETVADTNMIELHKTNNQVPSSSSSLWSKVKIVYGGYETQKRHGDCLIQYSFVKHDFLYRCMDHLITKVYSSISPSLKSAADVFLLTLPVGSTIIVRRVLLDCELKSFKSYARGKLLTKIIRNKFTFYAIVELLDEDKPPFSANLEDIFIYIAPPTKLNLPPRKRFLKLAHLEWYKESGGFHNVLHSVSGDLLLNRIVSVKVLSLTEDIPNSLYDAVVIISGKKYPMDDEDFPLGLNGLLVQLFVEYLEEPKLPMLNCNRTGMIFLNPFNNGDCFIGFINPAYEHLQRIMKDVNENVLEIPKMKKAWIPTSEEIYICRHNKDGLYYRARVIPNDFSNHSVEVVAYFLDLGDCQIVDIKKLIPAEYVHPCLPFFPAQAIKCHLAGVKNLDSSKFMSFIKTMNDDAETKRCGFILKVLVNQKDESVCEIEVRRPFPSAYETVNEELVASLCGEHHSFLTKQRIDRLRNTLILNPILLELAILDKKPFINTHCLIWSGATESFARLVPGEESYAIIYQPSRLESGDIVMFSPERFIYRRRLEMEMMVYYSRPWHINEHIVPFHLKTESFFAIVIPKGSGKVARRVKLLDTVFYIQRQLNRGFFEVSVYLIDYGIPMTVRWTDLKVLEPKFCKFPPFAVLATVVNKHTPNQDFLEEDEYRQSVVKILSINYNQDLPEAVVKIL